MVVIRAVCALAYCSPSGSCIGAWASIRLTFVLFLDICVAQAHQSHLEAENPYFAISSAGGRNRKRRIKRVQYFKSGSSTHLKRTHFRGKAILHNMILKFTQVKAVQKRSAEQRGIKFEHILNNWSHYRALIKAPWVHGWNGDNKFTFIMMSLIHKCSHLHSHELLKHIQH